MERWARVLVGADVSVLDAMRTLAKEQICLVADDKQRLLGTVTDGDVRRGILRSIPLTARVAEVMNPRPYSVASGTSRKEVVDKMRALKIRHIPIVDAGGIIVGLENLDEILDITATRPNAVVLVAGGTGNRLRPLTENTPKPLLNVGGRPLIDSIIDRFVEQGFRKFFLSVNYKAEMFEQHCGDGRRWGASISYIHEDRPLGTAGALGLINAPIEDPVLVMNADVLTKVDFRQMLIFHAEHQASATMAVREYGLQVPFGVVHTEGSRITGIDEKPEHSFFVNAGIYVLGPEALRQIRPQEPLDMPELFERLIGASKQTAAYPVCEYWIDVGRHDDFARANAEYDEMFR